MVPSTQPPAAIVAFRLAVSITSAARSPGVRCTTRNACGATATGNYRRRQAARNRCTPASSTTSPPLHAVTPELGCPALADRRQAQSCARRPGQFVRSARRMTSPRPATPTIGLLVFAQLAQVGSKTAGRTEGGGVVVAQDAAAAGEVPTHRSSHSPGVRCGAGRRGAAAPPNGRGPRRDAVTTTAGRRVP